MKGLLLKDFYLIKTVCRMNILIIVLFVVVSAFSTDNMFFLFFPCIISSMMPITLLSYDEHDKWTEYALTLPCTRAQIVSGKYLIGLAGIVFVMLLTVLVQALFGAYSVAELAVLAVLMLTIGLVGPAILYPLIFKFGIEKGRLFYYVFIGAACAGITIFTYQEPGIHTGGSVYLLPVVGAVLYAVSWLLSIRFYENRKQ